MSYAERPSAIPGAVAWRSVSDGTDVRVLPDGCMDLLWDGASLTVAGPDATAKLHTSASGSGMHGLRFAPGFAPRVLGVPAVELLDDRPELAALWGDRVARSATDLVASSDDPAVALERIAFGRWRRSPDDHLIDEVARLAADGAPVADIAADVGLSVRQLHRRSLDAFGYGAKTLDRILRLQRALSFARAGATGATAAALAGYADQPHLARDVKALTGVSLGALIAQRAANRSTELPSGSTMQA